MNTTRIFEQCEAAISALPECATTTLIATLAEWHAPQPIRTADGFRYRCSSHGGQWPCAEFGAVMQALEVVA